MTWPIDLYRDELYFTKVYSWSGDVTVSYSGDSESKCRSVDGLDQSFLWEFRGSVRQMPRQYLVYVTTLSLNVPSKSLVTSHRVLRRCIKRVTEVFPRKKNKKKLGTLMMCAVYLRSVILNVTFKINQMPIDWFINDPHPILHISRRFCSTIYSLFCCSNAVAAFLWDLASQKIV